jgi:hypothetical protein
MSYFRELPNLEYQSFLSDSNSSDQYLIVKNLFRRVKLRDDLQNVFTVFDKYQIPDGSRPELVAQELYGSTQYDWVVIVSAGITRLRDQWPLSDRQVYDYAESIYGNDLNAIHHYETTEVRDSEDRLILPAGQVVDEDFAFIYTDVDKNYSNSLSKISYTKICAENVSKDSLIIKSSVAGNNISANDELVIDGQYIPVVSVTSNTIENTKNITLSSPIPTNISEGSTLTFKVRNTVLIETNPVIGVSNYEYEVRKNNDKRSIYVLKPRYLQQVINDTRKAMIYDNSSQYVNDKLIKTENTKSTIPF